MKRATLEQTKTGFIVDYYEHKPGTRENEFEDEVENEFRESYPDFEDMTAALDEWFNYEN